MRRVAAALAVGLIALGSLLLHSSGVPMTSVRSDGVPMLEAAPADPVGAVVVVHGFAGSARLMRGFADTLVRHGYAVVIPDLAGHGTNTRPLPGVGTAEAAAELDRDLDAAVARLRTAYGFGPARIALVGHSMGATAVVRYAAGHPEIAATVAISVGGADTLPHDLLVLTGGLEFPAFHDAADSAAARGATAVTIAGTEHISVLYADATHRETAQWIDRALTGTPRSSDVHPRDRLMPAGLLVLGFLLGFVPLAALLLPRTAVRGPAAPASAAPALAVASPTVPAASAESTVLARPTESTGLAAPAGSGRVDSSGVAEGSAGSVPWGLVVSGATVGLVVATVAAGLLPTSKLPLAVGGYTAGFFVLVGAALLTAWAVSRRPRVGTRHPGKVRLAVATAILAVYAAAAIAVPIHLGFTNALPTGQRWWLLPVVIVATAVLLLGVELIADSGWVKLGLLAATTVAVTAAAVVGLAPGFIVLVVPLLAVLFVWHVVWASVLHRHGGPAVSRAVIGAVIVAWPIALTLPIVS